MAENAEHRGLCRTCRNAPTCAFPRDPGRPVLHCEEFDSDEPAVARPHGKAKLLPKPSKK